MTEAALNNWRPRCDCSRRRSAIQDSYPATLRPTHGQLTHFGRAVCLHDVPWRYTKPFAEVGSKVASARHAMVKQKPVTVFESSAYSKAAFTASRRRLRNTSDGVTL